MLNIREVINTGLFKGDHFKQSLLIMELPFFFDGKSPHFYRFEGLSYSSRYESEFRKFTLNLDISLKVKTRFLISMFFNIPKLDSPLELEYNFNNYFLLNNGFSKLNILNNIKSINMNNNNYFCRTSLIDSIESLYGVPQNLSDISINATMSYNKFNRVVSSNFSDIDTIISGFNANWFDYKNTDLEYYNFVVVNDNIRGFSFLVSDLDNFRVLYSEDHNRYLFFNFASENSTYINTLKMINPWFNKNSYLFIYDYFIVYLNKFLKKNLDLFYYFNFIIKFILYNFEFFSNSINKNNLLLYLYLDVFIKYSYNNKFYLNKNKVLINSILSFLKYFNILSKNSFKFKFDLISSKSLICFDSKNIKNFISFNRVDSKIYFKKPLRKYRKCNHVYSLHNQPSEIFKAYSRFGFTPTVISYMTNFKNITVTHYAEPIVIRYRSILRVFSNFIMYFFKRNFITNILTDFNYDSSYIFYYYFSIFKMFSTFTFKRMLIRKLKKKKLNWNKLLQIFSYLLKNKESSFLSKFQFYLSNDKNYLWHFKYSFYPVFNKSKNKLKNGKPRKPWVNFYYQFKIKTNRINKKIQNRPDLFKDYELRSLLYYKKLFDINFEPFDSYKFLVRFYYKIKADLDQLEREMNEILDADFRKSKYSNKKDYNKNLVNVNYNYSKLENTYKDEFSFDKFHYCINHNFKNVNIPKNKLYHNKKKYNNKNNINNFYNNKSKNFNYNKNKPHYNKNKFYSNKSYNNKYNHNLKNINISKLKRHYSTITDEFDKIKEPIPVIIDKFSKFPVINFKIIFSQLFQNIFLPYDFLYMISLFIRLNKCFYIERLTLFIYYLFCHLFSFHPNLLEYVYNPCIYLDNFYIKDLRIFNSFELVNIVFNINLFYHSNLNSILIFDDFILKVDLYTFVILRRFLEYFRIFKYNEYIFYHLGANIKFINYKDFKLKENDYAMLPSFYEFRHALFFNKYLICRLNIYNRKQLIYCKEDIDSLYVKISFFLFYFIAFIYEKLYFTLISYFSFYIISNIYFCLYRSLIYLPKRIQILKITGFEWIPYKLEKDFHFNNILFQSIFHYLYLPSVNDNYFYFDKIIFSLDNFFEEHLFIYKIISCILYDYIDLLVFRDLLNFDSMTHKQAFKHINSMFLNSFIENIHVEQCIIYNLHFFKYSIDFFNWQIFKFSKIANFNNLLYNNFILYLFKYILDNSYINTEYSIIKFLKDAAVKVNLSFYLYMFLFYRDFTFKLIERFHLFSYLNFHYYFFFNSLKVLQFNYFHNFNIKHKYYWNFDKFYNHFTFKYYI